MISVRNETLEIVKNLNTSCVLCQPSEKKHAIDPPVAAVGVAHKVVKQLPHTAVVAVLVEWI